ncbi:MAG: macro domain-containing protein [Lachnospiraceae bacterium]|nr:macro domain-containing protein [Lachnospiraceae bacterium]
MPFKIVRNDITKMQVDVIVNTANKQPIYSAGTDTAVYKAAGEEELLAERRKIGCMKEGEVAITPGFRLPAKYIIHAVSPCYIDGKSGEEEKLRDCYRRSLQLAAKHACKSIAFPLISTGSFGYPKEEGMRIALDEINAFLMKQEMLVYLVVFDTKSTQLGLNLYPDLKAYIDHNYVCDKREEEYGDRYFGSVREGDPGFDAYRRQREKLEMSVMYRPEISEQYAECEDDSDEAWEERESALEERMKHLSDTFQEYLLYMIETKNLTNADVYKRALISKQLFSKIKLNPNYHPDKKTAMRLCVGAMISPLSFSSIALARSAWCVFSPIISSIACRITGSVNTSPSA